VVRTEAVSVAPDGLVRALRRRGIDPTTVRVSYGKVAEMQRRGVVHFHAIIRLDGVNPTDPEAIAPVPDGIGLGDLVDAVDDAARHTRFITEAHGQLNVAWLIEWGDQLDIRPVRIPGDGTVSDEMVAGYLAKYATKSTEASGHVSRRLTHETTDLFADPSGSHIERLIHACWSLGGRIPGLTLAEQGTRPYKGCADGRTCSASAVTSLPSLAATPSPSAPCVNGALSGVVTIIVITSLNYVGAGWLTAGDALLANTAAALARERQRIGRIETTSLN